MTYFGMINYAKAVEWELGKTTVHLMPIFADLPFWAKGYVKPNVGENESAEMYFMLFREKILSDIPFLGSLSAVSRGISELLEKEIIKREFINGNPCYALTPKGMEWKARVESEDQTAAKPFNFQFKRSMHFSKLSKIYIRELKKFFKNQAEKMGLDAQSEFNKFSSHYTASSTKSLNFSASASKWLQHEKDRLRKEAQKDTLS